MHANLVIAKKAAAAVAAAQAKARKEEAKRKSKSNSVDNKAVPQAKSPNPAGAEEMWEEERGGGTGDARGTGGDDQRGSG